MYENSNTANYGHGGAFYANVAQEISNIEYAYLESYINMFRATKDKRYLNKFIIHTKRVQERRDDNITQI